MVLNETVFYYNKNKLEFIKKIKYKYIFVIFNKCKAANIDIL